MKQRVRANSCVLILTIVTTILLAGCGRGDAPDLANVTGTVTRGGKPVADLLVYFLPDHGRMSFGLTDARGRFKLYYTKEEDGARFGEHRVYVDFNQAQPASFAGDGSKGDQNLQATLDEPSDAATNSGRTELSADDRNDIRQKYGDPKRSPLRITIDKNGQTVELKLD